MARDLSQLTVAVTGASGLVGGHVARFLAENGCNVIAVVRKESNLQQLTEFQRAISAPGKLELRTADVRDLKGLEAALLGAEVVVHAAGTVDPHGSRQAIFDTNVGGTKAALAAAKQCGVQQFIMISSLSVITGQGDQYNLDETAPLRPCGEPYADSKLEAEALVMKEAEANDIKVTALRPGFIYGPNERAWMPRLINSIGSGKAMLIDGGLKETNVIYIENLCRAVNGAILNEQAYGRVYNLTDGQKVSKKELFDAISSGLNLPPVTKKVPGVVAKAVCELVSSVAPALPPGTRQKLARYSRAAFRLAGVNQGFSIARAERELGYVNRISFEEGMSRTLATFRTVNSNR